MNPVVNGAHLETRSSAPAKVKVLFIIGAASPTSVPLDLAEELQRTQQIEMQVIAYRHSANTAHASVPVLALGTRSQLSRWWTLCRLITTQRFDVIHVHHGTSSLIGAVIGRVFTRSVIVATEHRSHEALTIPQRMLSLARLIFSHSVVCNSSHTRSSIGSLATKLGKKKIQVIHNGVALGQILSADVEHSDDLLSSDKDPRSLILGTVGRLIPEKGLHVLLHALKRTMLSAFMFQVVVVGDGPCLKNLRKEVESMGLTSNVRFMGEVDRRTVYRMLYGFDIFVMTSHTEGFCNAVVEAMAARRCLVCSDAGALPEVVGDTAITVPVGSAGELASALEAIATNPDLRRQLGQRARERATQNFSLDKAAEKHDRMYRSLLSSASGRPL